MGTQRVQWKGFLSCLCCSTVLRANFNDRKKCNIFLFILVPSFHIAVWSTIIRKAARLLGAMYALQRKSHVCIPFLGIARPQSQFPYSSVCERFIYSQDRSTYIFGCSKIDRPIQEIYKSFTDILYEYRNWERTHYNTVLEIRRLHSFISGNT